MPAAVLELSDQPFQTLFGSERGAPAHQVTGLPGAHELLLRDFVRGRGPARRLDGFELRVRLHDDERRETPCAALALHGEVIAFLDYDHGAVHYRSERVAGWRRGRLRRLTDAIELVRLDEGVALSVPQIWGALHAHWQALASAPER